MNELDLGDIYTLWTKAYSINEAIIRYCDDVVLDSHPINEFRRVSRKVDYPKGLLGQYQRLEYITNELNSYQAAIYENLTDKIRNSDLLCIAHGDVLGGQPEPYIVDRSKWPPDSVNLQNSSITHKGTAFSNVRIFAVEEIDSILKGEYDRNPNPTKKQVQRGPGPTSYEKEIDHAYSELLREAKIDFKSLKSNVKNIQQKVRQLYPHIKGDTNMRYEAIRRAVMERFKQDKANL